MYGKHGKTLEELRDYFYKYQNLKVEVFKEAANGISQLYFECLSLGFNIRDDSYNFLDVNDMRLVFWFDS